MQVTHHLRRSLWGRSFNGWNTIPFPFFSHLDSSIKWLPNVNTWNDPPFGAFFLNNQIRVFALFWNNRLGASHKNISTTKVSKFRKKVNGKWRNNVQFPANYFNRRTGLNHFLRNFRKFQNWSHAEWRSGAVRWVIRSGTRRLPWKGK